MLGKQQCDEKQGNKRARKEEAVSIALDVRDRLINNIGQQPIQQYLLVYDKPGEDLGYVELVEIGEIFPIELPQGIKFDITCAMI